MNFQFFSQKPSASPQFRSQKPSASSSSSNNADVTVLLDGMVLIRNHRKNLSLQQDLVDYCTNIFRGKEEEIDGLETDSLKTPKAFLDVPFEKFKSDFSQQFCFDMLNIAKEASPVLKDFEDQLKLVQMCYYTQRGRLGWHRDRIDGLTDEQQNLITSPVVSVSLGNDATFSYKKSWKDPEIDIVLKSGDVVVFGGPQRMVWHTVKKVHDITTKPKLLDMRGFDGRINLTFREGTYYPENLNASAPPSKTN